jgi:alkanesulfonate monooxygenase SsuD/methylene tetrahydromethanopterin reductase-like flavin-dependent oxidoreductase (luciferase family)
MASAWTASPWVEQHRDEVSFALHVFPIDTPAARLLAAGRLADDLGFDAFFVGDHPAWALDPWVHLAALAVTTRRIRLGVNVCCALYRHPVQTARLAADLDNLSGGRLILGLGNGWDANEFANLGLPFLPAPQRQARSEKPLRSFMVSGAKICSALKANISAALEHTFRPCRSSVRVHRS